MHAGRVLLHYPYQNIMKQQLYHSITRPKMFRPDYTIVIFRSLSGWPPNIFLSGDRAAWCIVNNFDNGLPPLAQTISRTTPMECKKPVAMTDFQPSARGRYLGGVDPYSVPEEGVWGG